MNPYTVLIAPRARAQIERLDAWWRENRPGAASRFVDELKATIGRLGAMPLTGPLYERPGAPANVRQLLMPRSRYHVFYLVESESRIVTLQAVWHATRGKGPAL